MKLPRFMIAAPASGSGKTLTVCGILQLLKNRGMNVAAFKCGPDYIDPMFHTKVIGTSSRNLDVFFTGTARTKLLMAEHAENCDISVVEGVMGYYDGIGLDSSTGGASDLAARTGTPVFLLVPAKGVSLSIIPVIKGFLDYQKHHNIKGIILNRISPMLYPRMKKMIEEQLKIAVVGYIPQLEDIHLESRHLGLVLPGEIENLRSDLNRLADELEKSLDIDEMLAIASQASDFDDIELNTEKKKIDKIMQQYHCRRDSGTRLRIAVAQDEAFCFSYADNLRLLEEYGAEIVEFSPIHDRELPEGIHGLIMHGGYPELYVRQLSENQSMLSSVRQAVENGIPTIAECGGFLYLHETLADIKGIEYPMCGILSGSAHYTGKLQRFGYVTLTEGKFLGESIGELRAHEFHYYDSDDYGDDFLAVKPVGNRSWKCGRGTDTLYAGFPHLYFFSNPAEAGVFLKKCAEYQTK